MGRYTQVRVCYAYQGTMGRYTRVRVCIFIIIIIINNYKIIRCVTSNELYLFKRTLVAGGFYVL